MIGSRTWGALRPFAIRFTLLAILVGLFVSLPLALPDGAHAGGGTLTVNDTGNGGDDDEGDGVCEVNEGEGDCSLRAAIEEANASGLIATIDFDGDVFDPDTINVTKSCLPFVEKTGITIDASVNDVDVTIDLNGCAYGLGALANENGFDFAILGGGTTLTIEDFALFGAGACGSDDTTTPTIKSDCNEFTLGDITIDGVTVTSTSEVDAGIVVVGADLDDINITNNNVDVIDGLVGVFVGAYPKGKPAGLIDGAVNISGNELIQGGLAGVIVDYCSFFALGTCDLGSEINVSVNNNDEINGGLFPGVMVQYCGFVSSNSDINVQINDNGAIAGDVGDVTGAPGVFVGIDTAGECPGGGGAAGSGSVAGDPQTNVNVTTQVNDNGSIGSSGGSGVEIEFEVCCGSDSSMTTEVSDTQGASDTIIIGPGGSGVDISGCVCGFDEDGNLNTTEVNGNGAIIGAFEAVFISAFVGSGNGHTSQISVNDNTSLSSTGGDGVVVVNGSGDTSNNNLSSVEVNGNSLIVAVETAVSITNGAGEVGDAIGAGAGVASGPTGAEGNMSDVEVNGNGVITGDSNGDGTGDGIVISGAAGAFDSSICAGCAGSVAGFESPSNGNMSNVDISGNGDISGGDEAIEVTSQAGTNHFGSATNNTSDVDIVNNGHITGDTDLDGSGTAIDVFSRAGTDDADGGVGDDNTSTVHILGTGETHVVGAAGINVWSEAGALCCGAGDDNTSTVVVNGNRDIIATDDLDAVNIITRAGAFGGDGDNNHALGEVSENRFITVECCKEGGGGEAGADGGAAGFGGCCNAVDIDAAAGGITSTSVLNSTTATVTGNDDITGGVSGVEIGLLVCCDSANTNTATVSGNQSITGEDIGILIADVWFVLSPGGICCSENTINIEGNDGTIKGDESWGILIITEPFSPLFGPSAPSHTVANINNNTISDSGFGAGIGLISDCCSTDGSDWSGSVITKNIVEDNRGSGIYLEGINGVTIGPANVIEGNGTIDTGIHIFEGDAGEADRNTITQNSISDNDGLGIDLDDGSCFPDATAGCGARNVVGCPGNTSGVAGGGSDTPNECLEFPGFFFLDGKSLSGTACIDCLVEIFLVDDDGDNDEHGEGIEYIISVLADGEGEFKVELPCGIGGGEEKYQLTSTATDKDGNTSEFGPNTSPIQPNPCDVTPTNTPGPDDTDTPVPGDTPTDTPEPTTATITICKDTNPENDDGKTFDFDTDIPGMGDPDLEDDDCDTEDDVDPDEYEIIENPPSGWELDEIDCDGIPSSRVDVDLGDNLVVIDVEAGDDIECTFTNVDVDPETSSIEICKDTNPETEDIDFDFEGDLDDFSLADDDCEEVTDLEAGEYEISEENIAEDWNLIEVDCTGTDEDNFDVDLDEGTVVVDLQEGEDVQCTFTNERKEAEATVTPTTTPTPTATPEQPTATDTPVPPTNTPTNTPVNTPVIPATPGNTIGDVNKNGVVNAIDAQLILQAEAGFITLANPKNADVNLDGRVDSRDAFLILQFVAAQVPSLPV